MGHRLAVQLTTARALRSAAAITVGCLLAGCSLFGAPDQGPSRIEQGRSVDTGRRRFDAYFAEVAELREKLSARDSDLFLVRQPLVDEMSVGVEAPISAVMAATRERVEKLKGYGVLLDLRLTPTPIVISQTGELAPDDNEDALLKAIQESALRGMSTFREYQQLSAVAEQLDAARGELAEDISRLPADFQKTELVEVELVGAGRVLDGVKQKLAEDTKSLALYLVALSEAVGTGGADLRDTSCDEALAKYKPVRPKRWSKKSGSAGTGRAPAATGPKGATTPAASRPASGGDFDM